ncbi:alpha/beta hydrolase [Nocardioides zeae]|uniref:Alpha/beta hydrolase n=1 Tax=Nocardioides imazamoxiresistens TaxID=3231893 RepID=A0ABU3PU07_9ACTN|nr:alpha/beta hydrolase [Nocardioides zeae]MDT9592290.1 alpha/beta hydrolase [Nocardioides zeae]
MTLDDATSSFLAQMAEQGGRPLHEQTPAEARQITAGLKDLFGPGPDVHRAETLSVPVLDGEIDVLLLVPTPSPTGLLVYFHGGGWVIGKVEEFETLGRRLAERTGQAVALVDYRLAPEHRFPTAVEDAWAALLWLSERSDDLLGGRVPLTVAGDSAGGNLAAVLARRATHGSGPEIARQVLVYPVTDCDLERPSYRDPANQLMLERASMVAFWDHYLPDVDARVDPDASPLRAEDLSGLPPAIVLTAEHDVLRDEGEAYAAALEAAGVPVDARRFDGQMHGFFTMVNLLPGADDALAYVADAIARQSATDAAQQPTQEPTR